MLENHMVLPSAVPAEYDGPDDDREYEFCAQCKKECRLDVNGWKNWIEDDLPGAGYYDDGFFCSDECHEEYLEEKQP